MDGQIEIRTRRGRRSGRHGFLALLLGALALGYFPTAAQASRMRHHDVLDTPAAMGSAWNQFLAAGPQYWAEARAPRFPSWLVLLRRNGQLVETPFIDYLIWRRNLLPARFDHYHPFVGPELGLLSPPTNSIHATGFPKPSVPPLDPRPEQSVPEPSALPIALSCLAAGIWYRRRQNRG